MSRLYTRTNRGRQPILGSSRMPRTKEYADQTYQESRGKRHRVSGKYAATVQQAKRRRISSTASDTSSGDLDGEDASGEESESEDVEEPAVLAPSRKTFVDGTGRFTPAHDFETASLAGSVDSMFGGYNGLYDQFEDPDLSPDENLKRFESNVFAPSDDDDDAYRAVDEISDSDDDDAEQYEEQQLMSALTDDDDDDILDEEFYLGQIEGLSAYGFGDESDASAQFPPSSHGSDAGVPTEHVPERHVRFDMESHFQPLSSSPTISRALLPSALPDKGKVFGGPASAAIEPFDESTTEDEYDSDATDDDLPEEALQTDPASQVEDVKPVPSPSPSPTPKAKVTVQRKGPPRGVFIDEGDKASGILDPSGKIMLITYPHLLGEEFARRYGESTSNSPSIGFQELIDESQPGDSNQSEVATPAAGADIMLASLNSQLDPANLGQAFGPQEAFYPALGFQPGDYAIDADDFDDDFDADLGEDIINMDDVIKFDDDSDSDDGNFPIFMPPKKNLSLGNASDFSHLTNGNVTAFRNNADPSYAAYSNTTSFVHFPEFTTPARSRKRRANDSPYTSSHYNGVTPVQRMKDPNPPSTPDSTNRPKRRRLMTA